MPDYRFYGGSFTVLFTLLFGYVFIWLWYMARLKDGWEHTATLDS
jgi:hypothetical protein